MSPNFCSIAEVCGCRNVEHSRPRLCRSFTDKEPLCGRIIAERANVYNRSSIGSERRRDEETHLSNQRGIGGCGNFIFCAPHPRRHGAAGLAGPNPVPSRKKEDGPSTFRGEQEKSPGYSHRQPATLSFVERTY